MNVRFQILLLCFASCVTPSHVRGGALYKYTNVIDVGNVSEGPLVQAYGRFNLLAESGAKHATLRIDSFGGSIFLGNQWIKAMEDTKKRNEMQVICIVDGAAYSMGAVILESPLCDIRYATPRSTILFHNGKTGAEGTAEDVKGTLELLAALNVAMALSISDRLKMPLAEYQSRIANHDWVLAVPAAMDCNVIDGVVRPEEIAPPAP